jgi:hypothetical protein
MHEKHEKPKRCECDGCKVKLTLTSFACKCEKYYCDKHRPSEVHSCTFNYREEQIRSLNTFMSSPVISAKVQLI